MLGKFDVFKLWEKCAPDAHNHARPYTTSVDPAMEKLVYSLMLVKQDLILIG